MFIALVMPSILWLPLLLPSIFPSITDFPMSQLLASDDQNTYWSFSFSIGTATNSIQGWFPIRLIGFISLLSKELSGVFSSTIVWRHQFFGVWPSLLSGMTTVHDHWEDHSLDYMDLCWQSNVSAFQHTVWVCHSFPAKKQMSSNFMAAVTITVILEPKRRKSVTISTFSPSICHEVMVSVCLT